MDKIVIDGGVPLKGEVIISGAKNAALPILAATLLAPGEHRLYNVPPLADIRTFKKVLGLMGVTFAERGRTRVALPRTPWWWIPAASPAGWPPTRW